LFRIAARTVLELGSELISSDIIAFYELIKNGFDAGTKNGVEIRFDIVLSRNSFTRLKKRVGDGGNLADLKSLITEEIDLRASQSAKDNFRQAIVAATSNSDLLQVLKDAQARFNTITIGILITFKEIRYAIIIRIGIQMIRNSITVGLNCNTGTICFINRCNTIVIIIRIQCINYAITIRIIWIIRISNFIIICYAITITVFIFRIGTQIIFFYITDTITITIPDKSDR